jgi:hypothetical protein
MLSSKMLSSKMLSLHREKILSLRANRLHVVDHMLFVHSFEGRVFITCIQFIVTSVRYRKDLSLPSLQLAAIARAFVYVRSRVQTYLGSS